jgi:uncharacterized protein with PQ loop repeat
MPSAAAATSFKKSDIVERWFYTAMATVMLAIVCAGFLPSIVNATARRAPLSPLAAAHGLVFLAWLLIFLIQARFIADHRIRIHKRTGMAALLVAGAMIPLGYQTCIAMVRRGFDLSGDLNAERDPAFLVVFPLGDLAIFSVLLTAAIVFRRRAHVHKTMILFANIVLMPAPLAHLIGHIPALTQIPFPIILIPMALLLAAPVAREFIMTGYVGHVCIRTAASCGHRSQCCVA